MSAIAVAASLGSLVAGRLADGPTDTLLLLLGICVVGGAVIDTVAKTMPEFTTLWSRMLTERVVAGA